MKKIYALTDGTEIGYYQEMDAAELTQANQHAHETTDGEWYWREVSEEELRIIPEPEYFRDGYPHYAL